MIIEAVHAVYILEQPSGSMDIFPFQERLDYFFNEVAYVT